MRAIDVTTDVYAAIWAARKAGENTESEILARVLQVPAPAQTQPPPTQQQLANDPIGFRDVRFDITLPEGFEIFRNYKGTEYRAQATNGQWKLLSTGELYPTFNQLSRAVTNGPENTWYGWYFQGRDGKRHLIVGLRNDQKPSFRHLI
ncbi:hypothetical protein [Mesorhizobium sp. CN2-181]|uniref:hypothetical protein n=1 Tax=Mesorhizobium yinganensis TaxID=3157707 RepID=UPI0032B723E3